MTITPTQDDTVGTWRLGIDIGGTFTDAVISDWQGRLQTVKVLSTPSDPSQGFVAALEQTREATGFRPSMVSYLTHATTVATNAIFEGKGARIALVVTRGFRDILEIGRQIRPSLFDVRRQKPPPLVPRDLCLEIDERIGSDGQVVIPLDDTDVREVAERLAELNLDGVVVCLLHSYANPKHERRVGQLLSARLGGRADVTLSSEVWPEFREYHRASTTLVNAAVRPAVRGYLSQLENELDARGLTSGMYVMRCDGGVMTTSAAKAAPVHLIESGPAAGLIAAAHLGRTLGWPNIISIDIGGTTAKAGLALDGEPGTTSDYEVGALATAGMGRERGSGYPIRIPVLDLVEIGAGGGSILWLDSGGVLRVGPQSAGATPGPACYGLGGERPTLTDANVALRRIDPDRFLGGAVSLDPTASEHALRTHCAQPLDLAVSEAAAGAVEIANASMTRLINLISVQRGYDPGEFVLIAFGGAGPLHANALAEQVGIPRILVPPHAGVLSAYGLLVADIRVVSSLTDITGMEEVTHRRMDERFAELADAVRKELDEQGVPETSVTMARVAEMRFQGQSYELPITVITDGGDAIVRLRQDFLDAHRRAYGYAAEGQPLEIVNWKVLGIAQTDKPKLVPERSAVRQRARPVGRREHPATGFVSIHDRDQLAPGDEFMGPAIISEPTATSYVESGWTAHLDEFGNLVIEQRS